MSLKHAGCFVDFERCACVQGNITDMTLGPLSRGKLKIEEEGEGGGIFESKLLCQALAIFVP